MTPAFRSTGQAVAFALLLLALLGLPAVMGRTRLLSREKVYTTMPVETGPYAFIQQQIFQEKSDLDLAFVGSSFMWVGIDAPYVQKELTTRLHREARVITLASVWPGIDRDYFLIRDLLEHRKVGTLVISLPVRDMPTDDPDVAYNRVGAQPHIQAFRFFRVGEFPEVTDGLELTSQISLYACGVFGMPRHLLSAVRPNLTAPAPDGALLGFKKIQRDYYKSSFTPFTPPVPAFAPESLIYRPDAPGDFRFLGQPINSYQRHFIRLIGQLTKLHGVQLVVLHVPLACERTAAAVVEREYWPAALGVPVTLIGVAPQKLFAGLADEEIKRFYSSDHLNVNGATYFTRAVTTALLSTYAQSKTAP